MVELLDGYVGSSCIMKAKNDNLISMEVLRRIGKNFIGVGSSCDELPTISYSLLIKIEVYNTQPGFKVLIGRTYPSSPKLARTTDLNEATNDEKREYFRISIRGKAVAYSCMRGDKLMNPGEGSEYGSTGDSAGYNGLKVQLADISLGGLMSRTDEIFEINDRLNVVIPTMSDSTLFACEVRRQMNRLEGGYGYGCGFTEMATRQENLLYHYIPRRQGDQFRRIQREQGYKEYG